MTVSKEEEEIVKSITRQIDELKRKAGLADELAVALKLILEECDDPNLAYHISPLFYSRAQTALAKYETAKGVILGTIRSTVSLHLK
jgi:hypothetical protein